MHTAQEERMGINLWILYHDLEKWNVRKYDPGDVLKFPLEHFRFYKPGMNIEKNYLYVVNGCDLPNDFLYDPDISFLCIGEPDVSDQKSMCALLWLPEDTNREELLAYLSELFYTYQKWLHRLECISLDGSPLKQFGTESLPLFRNPLGLFHYNFLTLFYFYDEKYGKLPENYSAYVENTFVTEETMLSIEIDDSLKKAMSETLPYHFYNADKQRSLCHNIWVNHRHIATLQVDEINHLLCERDTALLYLLGNAIGASMMKHHLVNLSLSTEFQKLIQAMLKRENIDLHRLQDELHKKGWKLTENYSCIVCCPINESIPENALFVNGESFVEIIPNSIYIIFQNQILLFWNRTHIDTALYWTSLKKLRDKLADYNFMAGVSNDFQGFEKIPYFQEAAFMAIRHGSAQHPGQYLYYYETCILPVLYDKCLHDTSVDTFMPSELLHLIQHDRERHGDSCKVLECLLRNNMNTTETANELFMHRNTVINRTAQFKEKYGMNLNNYEYRLKLMIAFELLKYKGLAP